MALMPEKNYFFQSGGFEGEAVHAIIDHVLWPERKGSLKLV